MKCRDVHRPFVYRLEMCLRVLNVKTPCTMTSDTVSDNPVIWLVVGRLHMSKLRHLFYVFVGFFVNGVKENLI